MGQRLPDWLRDPFSSQPFPFVGPSADEPGADNGSQSRCNPLGDQRIARELLILECLRQDVDAEIARLRRMQKRRVS